MATQIPIVGAWYQDLVDNQMFEIVAVDEQGGTIEIQYLGGEVSEFDLEGWSQLVLEPAEAPEDARAGYELSREDGWDNDQAIVPESWSSPLSSIEPESFTGFDDFLVFPSQLSGRHGARDPSTGYKPPPVFHADTPGAITAHLAPIAAPGLHRSIYCI